MAWESAGSREEGAKPRPRETFPARKARGRGDPGSRTGETPRRGWARRERPRGSGRGGRGRAGQVGGAGRGRAAVGGGSGPEPRAVGIPGKGPQGRPARGLRAGRGCRASPGAGRAAAAAAQVAEPGGGGASSPSPGPAARGAEGALKGAGAAAGRTSPWVGLWRGEGRGGGWRLLGARTRKDPRGRKRTDPRKKRETSAVTWGMAVGPRRRTREGSACAPGAPAESFSPGRAGRQRESRLREGKGDAGEGAPGRSGCG